MTDDKAYLIIMLALTKGDKMIGVKEIAAKAGVSMITVSRVINTPEKVSPETRERILKIIN